MEWMQTTIKRQFCKAFIMGAAFACNAEAMASTCFGVAVQRYNKARHSLEAPYNYAQVVYAGKAPVECTISSLYLGEYSVRLRCGDGYRYEIGTTGYCGRGGVPNCDKAIVTTPSGQSSYRSTVALGSKETCTSEGAQLEISNKVFLDNRDVLIITTHQFRK